MNRIFSASSRRPPELSRTMSALAYFSSAGSWALALSLYWPALQPLLRALASSVLPGADRHTVYVKLSPRPASKSRGTSTTAAVLGDLIIRVWILSRMPGCSRASSHLRFAGEPNISAASFFLSSKPFVRIFSGLNFLTILLKYAGSVKSCPARASAETVSSPSPAKRPSARLLPEAIGPVRPITVLPLGKASRGLTRAPRGAWRSRPGASARRR